MNDGTTIDETSQESAPAAPSLTYRDLHERDKAMAEKLEGSFSKYTLAQLAVQGLCNELWLRGMIVTGFDVASRELLARAESLEQHAKAMRSCIRAQKTIDQIEDGTWRPPRRPRRKRRAKNV